MANPADIDAYCDDDPERTRSNSDDPPAPEGAMRLTPLTDRGRQALEAL